MLKTKSQKIKSIITKFKNYPKKYTIGGGVAIIVIIFAVVAFWPRTITFSYANSSCINQPLLLPGILQSTGSDDFSLQPDKKTGPFAGQVCAQSTKAPKEGDHRLLLSLFGIPLGTPYVVSVTPPPVASFAALNKPLPISKPLVGSLDKEDTLFTYTLSIDDRKTECLAKSKKISCDVPALKLAQGAGYKAQVSRHYKKEKEATTLTSKQIQTLTAVAVKDTSIKKDEIVYAKPKSLQVSFDKPIESAKATILRSDNTKEERTTRIEKTNDGITVSWEQDLAREVKYELVVDDVVARDGSSLAAPLKVPFSTSGGPKVTNVSVGTSNVAQSASIVLTFDQNITKTKDFIPYVKINGVTGSVRKIADNQIQVQLAGAPLCQAFSITVDKNAPSEFDIPTTQAWTHNSRISCQNVVRYGTSVQGRPLMAYVYGNGQKRILFTGGIHGNERSTVTTMQAWIDYLNANAHTLPANTQVIVAPNLNPDGIAIGKRYNANNVNLGRNFPSSNWKADAVTQSGNEKGVGGSSAGSEPETRALMSLTSQYRPRLIVSVHSQGRLVGANKYGDSVAVGNIYAGMVGYRTMYDNAEDVMGYSITGEFEEWVGEVYGTPAILIELPSHAGNYFVSQQKALIRMLNV